MSIVTTMASVTHAVLVMDRPGVMEAIFGTVAPVLSLAFRKLSFNTCIFSFLFTGGVEASVSVIVSSMSVIIPAILRALDVGDPFMQEDTVDPGLGTTVEIARMDLTRVELGLPTIHTLGVGGGDDREVIIGSVTPNKLRDSVGLEEKDDQKHRLTTQTSDGSLGTSITTKVTSHADECGVPDPKDFEVMMSLPEIEKHSDIEGDAGGKKAKHQTT